MTVLTVLLNVPWFRNCKYISLMHKNRFCCSQTQELFFSKEIALMQYFML